MTKGPFSRQRTKMKERRTQQHRLFAMSLLSLSLSWRVAHGFVRNVPRRPTTSRSVSTTTSLQQAPFLTRNDRASLLTRAASTRVNGSSGSDDTSTSASSSDTTVTFPHASLAERTRPDFGILTERTVGSDDTTKKPLIYLDSAATSQKPKQVLDALNAYYSRHNANVHRGAHQLSREATDLYEGARDKVAAWLGAESRSEIVFCSGATEAMNLVVHSYGRPNLKKGDEVLLTVTEHHSNLVPWQLLARETGCTLRFVPMDPKTGGLDLDQFESMLSDKTKLVSFQHVSNVLGVMNPVTDMVKMVRERASPDAKILLDACQSVPHMPVNVQELGVDFLAASGHKACAPTGIGVLWGRLDLLNSMPPYKGGGEMIDQVTLTDSTWQDAPGRFEAGTPAIAQAVGLGAAVDYLMEIGGMEEINAYEHEIGAYLFERLSQVNGITILGPQDPAQRAALCSFVHDTVHPSDLSTFLDVDGVAIRAGHHCCQPLHEELGYSHSARASLYFYNTKSDVDAFIESLERTIDFFTGLEGKGDGGGADDEFVPFV